MNDTKELLQRAQSQFPPPEGVMDSLIHRRDRKRRNQRIAAGVVGIAVFVAAVWVVTTAGSFDRTATPADKPTVNSAGAEGVALRFLDAYAAFDAQKAMTYVADDADLTGLIPQVPANMKKLSLLVSFNKAVGYRWTITWCQASPFGSDTGVVCAFDFHMIGSDQIGRGPFSGDKFVFTVRDGKIIKVGLYENLDEFGPQVWLPFAEWVSSTYPKDAAVMYLYPTNETLIPTLRLSPESIRLWKRHTPEYVEAVQQGTG